MTTPPARHHASRQTLIWRAFFASALLAAVVAGVVIRYLDAPIWAGYLAGINAATFAVYGYDKRSARVNRTRVPERALLLLGFFGGTLGALAGQRLWRHKTMKRPFQLWFWALTVVQVGAVALWMTRRRWM